MRDQLISLRKKKQVTQKEVADHIQVSRVTYTQYETGTRFPSLAVIYRLADYFQVSTDFLLGREENPADNLSIEDELFRKRRILFDKSAKATPGDLDKVIKMLDIMMGDLNHE